MHADKAAKARRMSLGASPRVLAAALAAAAGGFACETRAQEPARQISETRVSFDIPAQPLSSALSEFARQSGVRVLFAYDNLNGARAPALRGAFTREEALARLLAGSEFAGHIDGDGVVRLEQRPRPQPIGAEAPLQTTDEPQPNNAQQSRDAAGGASDNADAEVIVVTGTRIRGAPPAGSLVIELDAEAIEQTGRGTVQEVLQTLPQNFAGSQNEFTQEGAQNARQNFSYASTVDLRGLGADATLILVDGHRLAPAGQGGYIDISTIPLSAIERVEVLADGASAAYGADAVAGVVNLVLADRFDGAETRLRVAATAQGGASERAFSQLLGAAWNGGQIMGAYEYRARDELSMLDRDFLASADFTNRGGTDYRRTLSNPGNIIRIGATAVSLAIPAGQDGSALSEADLIAGQLNRNELNEGAFFLPDQESHSFFLRFRQELFPSLELYGHAIGAERRAYAEREQLFANLVVPETNAWQQLNNLFPGQGNLTVAYFFGDDLGPVRNRARVRAWSGVLGARYDFGDSGWRFDASTAYARSQEAIANENFYNSLAIGPALASSDLASAFNPFADGSNTSASVLAGLTFDIETENDAESIVTQVQADGPLFRIWGGDVRAAFGVERRQERFEIARFELYPTGPEQQFIQDPGKRTVEALFGELYIPLIGPENGVPFAYALTVSASVRSEDASDYGDAVTPRFGVRWALSPDLALRASWGQSFKGPLFQQQLGDIFLGYLAASPAQDPLADNGSTGVLTVAGSNGNLRPERAETWTAGFDYAPRWAPSLNLHASYFDIDFADRIASAGGTFAILANPAGFESVIFRDPSPELIAQYLALGAPPTGVLPAEGVEVIIDRRFLNLSSQRLRGVDLSANWSFDTGVGAVELFAAATGLLQFEQTLTPGATPVELLDTVNNPIDWRARFGLTWRGEQWSAGLTGNYADGYRDTFSQPNRDIEAHTTWDLRFTHSWGESSGDGPAIQLALNVINAFDEAPPFVNNPTGYAFDASNASPLGRVVSLELRRRW